MRRWLFPGMLGVALAVSAQSAVAVDAARGVPEIGVAVAAGSDDGTLLLRRGDTFSVLVVGMGPTVRDRTGRSMRVQDIRAGDRVEYVAETWAGMSLARTVRVSRTPAAASAR